MDEELKDGEIPKINGSVMMAWAESKDEVLAALKEDIYSTSGVWDWEKVTIHPVSLPVLLAFHHYKRLSQQSSDLLSYGHDSTSVEGGPLCGPKVI